MHILNNLRELSFRDTSEYNFREGVQLRDLIRRSLDNHKELMDIRWSALIHVGVSVGVIDDVYDEGWDFNSDTKNLRRVFQEFVTPSFLNKSLEDYV